MAQTVHRRGHWLQLRGGVVLTGDGTVGLAGVELTEASLPVAETAATVRLDCRRAFLNIVHEVQRE